jgi:Fic family protein
MLTQIPAYSRFVSQAEKDSLVTGVASTDTIEGGDISAEEAASVLDNPGVVKENRERRIANLGKAYSVLDKYIARHAEEPVLPLSEKYIRLLHIAVTRGLTDGDYNPGRYRNNPKGINTYVGDTEHGGRYKAPQAHDDICMLMNAYTEWISSPEMSEVHPFVRAILLHYYFERIHPFSDGNGRIGRLIEKAVLVHSDYRVWARALDRYYLENIHDYYIAFNECRKAESKNPERCNEPFITFALSGMAETIERFHEQVGRLADRMLQLAFYGDLLRRKKINPRQHEILEMLMDAPKQVMAISDIKMQRWYRSMYKDLSPATESRDWSGLEELGFIRRSGKLVIVSN